MDARWSSYGAPMTIALFAGIRVRDLTAARAWYERLLGEPAFFPNATEVVAERETYSNGVRKLTYRDDDGNEVGFGGGPANG